MKLLWSRRVLSFISHEPRLEEVFLAYYQAGPNSAEAETVMS
jgi:hypothetical protein